MPDTSRGDYPDNFCCDCGEKGCEFCNWGPIVPDGKPHYFCNDCFIKRRDYYHLNNAAKPLPESHNCNSRNPLQRRGA